MKRLKAQWVKLTAAERLYQRPYPIVAVTGGIASGKSTLIDFLRKQEVPVISADQLIKDIYGWPATHQWLSQLRPAVIKEGAIDFTLLRSLVFADSTLKSEIENYLYARLPQAFAQAEKRYPLIPWLVYEIPLLFERGMEELFDVKVVCWVRQDIQKERLLKRDTTTTVETAQAILKAQLPLDEKRQKADLVFDNSGAPDPKNLRQLWDKLVD